MDLEEILAAHGVTALQDTAPKEDAPVKASARKRADKGKTPFTPVHVPKQVSDNLHRLQTAILVCTGGKRSLGDIIDELISHAGEIYGEEVGKMMRRLK